MNTDILSAGWRCKCPRCREGNLYKPGFTITLNNACPECGLDLSKNDSADGPAVFLIFILGFALVPAALLTDSIIQLPVWLHIMIFGTLALGLTLGMLRPLKAYIIALQFKHRPGEWQ